MTWRAEFEFRIFRIFGVSHWHLRVRKHQSPGPGPKPVPPSLTTPASDLSHGGASRCICRYPPMRSKILPHSPTSSARANSYLCLLLGPRIIRLGDDLMRTGLEAGQAYLGQEIPWFWILRI